MKETFVEKEFKTESLHLIHVCNVIVEDYQAEGYSLTLRQLYYQLVARDVVENTERSYDRIGRLISDARLAGLIDWDAIEDRTRNVHTHSSWESPAQIVQAAAEGFRMNPWESQLYHVECWVEKEALAGVIEKACARYRVPHLSCRGYMSQSEQYAAAKRFEELCERGKRVVVLHLGDHDPSGIDMTRDNEDRLQLLTYGCDDLEVRRIALNMDQIREFRPPPNPAKVTDSRSTGYITRFGPKSWELDALSPSFLDELINREVERYIDEDAWDEAMKREEKGRAKLRTLVKGLGT